MQAINNAPPVYARVEVVTLTVTTSGSSTPTSQSSSGGSTSVPIAAIAGGAAGGVTLAVLLVLIWKYWGLVIKRDERKRRKEARDMLTVRENTRRNAASGFKPQSQYRPMLALNPDRRKVTFLTRGPTSSRKKQQKQQRGPSPVAAEEKQHNDQGEGEVQAPALVPAPPATEETETRQPSLNLTLPPGAPPELQGTSERPTEDDGVAAQTELLIPSPTPAPAPAPTSPSTPTTTPDTAPAAHTPEPPVPARRIHTQWSSPAPTARSLTSSGSSSTHGHAAPRVGSSQAPPVPALPPVSTVIAPPPPPLPAGAAPPTPPAPSAGPSSASALSWAATTSLRSPLHSSVLPAPPDRPVIMPRPKNAPLTTPLWAPPVVSASQPASPASSRPHVPSLASSASQYSGNSGEPPVRRGFLNVLRHKAAAPAAGSANVRRTSTYSSASAYSND
ncbi:hypothetical protein BJY52DRAFT_567871 [Lactarius psammicola]|nr:hypothetical protein BJY52DRAFT_567871 [Lactarius psammicola]